jgi:large subunit ribosomal protein L10
VLKSKKTVIIKQMGEVYLENSCFIVSRYQGLSVSQITSLRKSLKNEGCGFKIVKNSLSKIAADQSKKVGFGTFASEGLVDDKFSKLLSGPIGIAYANDPVLISKKLVGFAKNNAKLQIIGGVIDNKFYSDSQILELSKLSSIEEVRSKLIRVIQTPASNIARVLLAYSSQNKE